MEDSDDSDAKLREEIEAELDKISVSSLEINEAESDSESETQSDNSDTDLIELPESVLHCISVIKNKSKTAEELILQDLEEDVDVSSCSSGTVPNSHRHLRIGSSMESKANSEQLMKILSAIEKEEFMRSLTHSAKSDSVPEPATLDTPMDECILSDDADLSFEYFEVEERCRKSFEAWQDKQKELEEKDKETLEVQSDIEKQKFQEEDEKRHFWIKQFEVEKKKLENLQKQDQDKMNDELYKEEKIWKEKYREHEELIRNMHLQMEEERTRLCELQEKEKARLLNLQHNAAVKIQAKYKALVTYRKYSPIIREQIENKKRKAQEQKEREVKIRQKEEERRQRIKEEQKMEEERKKKMLEERRRREREYEEKKSLLRQEREEQRNKEKMRQSKDAHKLLTINCTFKKGKCHGKQQAAANKSQSKADIAEELVDTNSEKTEDACLVQQSNKRENVHTQHKQLTLKESIGVKLTPSQAILAELKINENLPKLKVNENSENLSKKQCSEKLANQEIVFKNTDQRGEWKNSDLKENVTQECQRHELKPQNHKEETVMYDTKENAGQKNQKMFAFNQEMSEEDKNERQEIKGNQERLVEKSKKMEITQQESSLYGENNTSSVSTQKDPPSLILENPKCAERNVILEDKEIGVKSKRIEELPEDSVLTGDAVVLNSDASVITGGKTDQQGPTEGRTDQKDPTEGRTDQQGPTKGKTDQQGPTEGRTDQKDPTEGRTDQQGPTEGKTDQQGPTEGRTDQKDPTEGRTDQQGPTKGKTDQQGPTEGRTDQKDPTEGRTDQQGPTEGRTEQQGPPEGRTDQHGPTEGRTEQQGPPEGRTEQQGPTEGRTEQQGPPEGRTDQQGPTEGRTDQQGPTEGRTDQQGPTEGRTDQQGPTEGRTDQQGPVSGILASSSESGSHSANSPLLTEEGEDTPKCDSRENLGQWEPKKSESNSALACSVSQRAVLSSVEERRLAWIKSSKPWSEIFEQNQLKKIIKKKRLVKCPANTMPPLDSSAILQHGPWDTLQQVKDITFQDLPGCSLSTLADYSNLQLLCLRRCGLTSLHSLSHCKNLKYIDVQENHIETINCENLENLCVVLLNKNLLTSIHGFDGCTNIQSLELSHNKITRISGLESLKYLQQLTVDHNQLISTKGLCEAPTIIYLDCSHNHLTDVDGIGNCGLLQIIKLQGNYLREPPSLRNHVLLRELHLDDNSISNMEVLSSCWLPLLQALSISQNSLTTIVPLFHFVSLEKLDVRNNCLSDLTSIMCWFNACYSLRELALTGNPVLQEINWRDSVLNTLPALRILNGDMLNSCSDIHIEEHCHQDLRCFLALCQSQLQEFSLLTDKYITQKGDSLTLHAADKLSHYYKNLMKLSNECRHAHEHGAVNIMKRAEPEVEKKDPAFSNTDSMLQNEVFHSWTDNYKPDSPDSSENLTGSGSRPSPLTQEELEERNQETLMAQQNECSRTNSLSIRRASFIETKMGNSLMSSHRHAEQSEPVKAAVLIQAQWRRHIARRQINCAAKMHPTARETLHNPFLSNRTTSNKGRRENFMNSREQREKAALQIQAVWKGFILRKKLLSALEAIRNEESGEEYEEIDLEEFAFDEDVLEKDWPALDSTSFPSQTLPLSNQLPWPKTSRTLRHDEPSLPVPARPAPAWLSSEKETVFSPTHTQLSSSRSENRTLSWTTESKTSRKSLLQSEKEEKISEEWGFKDISTAQQMLKRAQKMKSKKLKKNLEPSVRLALFKKTRNKVPVTKSSKKTQHRRDGYFEDEEEDALSKATTASEKLERSKEYTYQWLHTQVGFPEATSSRNLKCHHFLPELDPDVLNGGRVQLVARLVSREDTDLDLFSTTSGSALSVNKEKKSQSHRFSTGSSSGSSKGIIAPVITNTRPCVKERISFRDNPLQLSGGWGSGKKKAKFST